MNSENKQRTKAQRPLMPVLLTLTGEVAASPGGARSRIADLSGKQTT